MLKLVAIIFIGVASATLITCVSETSAPTNTASPTLFTQAPIAAPDTPTPETVVTIAPTPPAAAPTRHAAPVQRPYYSDEDVLIALYHATGGPNWNNNQNWLSDEPVRKWYGVRFHEGRVAELRLPDNGLTGEIPPELQDFERLIGLDLGGNQLTGDIPQELWNLRSLVMLDLSGNRLTGEISPELGNLKGIKKLLLAGNQLTGDLPEELG